MENPMKSNGYEKYLIQIGWFYPEPMISIAVLAQDILTKSKKDGEFLIKLLYPESLGMGLPYLCPVIEILNDLEVEEELNNLSTNYTIELLYPN